MNSTDSLIDQLAQDGAAPRPASLPRFVAPLALAMAICAIGIALVLEAPFIGMAINGPGPMLVKWGFSIALLLLSGFALWFIGRPGKATGATMATLAVPFILLAALLGADLAIGQRAFPGETWQRCLAAMAVMSPIAFGGAILAARWLAPTNLHRAGLVAGMFGGAAAMTAYSPHCPEHGMAYVAVFYCLPILTMAALGWLLGPRLLRW
ncbi:NrsF family protein [Aurantiacibacter rhizosphaerae]|uniref:DUF1109 family protein n=1 Tax=Aurantiacibacter rhizosphaerae TaxID=2691582 RepID=A0A844XEN6_9SPHN|nr:DUF1109 domain-containing protein [Aurantiacibacter rhizosphaerae]MWV28213.1 DUF1109 family protein [Aurantiacibacter rhizosphaerae]